MKKLSPAQVRVLKALAEPGIASVAHYMSGIDPYWFLSNRNGRIRCATMRWLIQFKLIKPTYDAVGYFDYAIITPAGRAYLEQLDKEEEDA